jgi:predicted SPOUT superfamily RNA methylase MTH1
MDRGASTKRKHESVGGNGRGKGKGKGKGKKQAAGERGRKYTVSVALPGSIVANAQTAELKTYLCGQVARAAVVFNIDEIIVFSDRRTPGDSYKTTEGQFQGAIKGGNFDADVFLARILQYLETPQYLRRILFPVHKDLRYAGLLNPLDCPHHPRAMAFPTYREGVTVDKGEHSRLRHPFASPPHP